LRDRPDVPVARLHQLRDAMDRHAGDCLVTGYEPLIEGLSLPDPDDRHVLAAAIAGCADVIVTSNFKYFPDVTLEGYGIKAQHPDEFVRHLIDLAPVLVIDAVCDQQASLVNPPMSMSELLAVFERLSLMETVLELRRLMNANPREDA
jgi:hypothetical protein